MNQESSRYFLYIRESSRYFPDYVEEYGVLAVPMHLRNAPTELMKELGYGKRTQEENLPEKLKGKKYYP